MRRTFQTIVSIPLPRFDDREQLGVVEPALDDHDLFMDDELRTIDRER